MKNKEGRLEEAQRLKRSWRKWRGEGEFPLEEDGELDFEFDSEFLGNTEFCLSCAMSRYCCLGTTLDKRIEMIRLEDSKENLEYGPAQS